MQAETKTSINLPPYSISSCKVSTVDLIYVLGFSFTQKMLLIIDFNQYIMTSLLSHYLTTLSIHFHFFRQSQYYFTTKKTEKD